MSLFYIDLRRIGAFSLDRERELEEIERMLDSGLSLILIGPQWVGKTSLTKVITSIKCRLWKWC
jgi:Archaeal ATPase.